MGHGKGRNINYGISSRDHYYPPYNRADYLVETISNRQTIGTKVVNYYTNLLEEE